MLFFPFTVPVKSTLFVPLMCLAAFFLLMSRQLSLSFAPLPSPKKPVTMGQITRPGRLWNAGLGLVVYNGLPLQTYQETEFATESTAAIMSGNWICS